MVRDVCKARSAAQYLVIWFVFSDGVGVCGTIAVLFADAEVEWGCIPKGIGLWAMTTSSSLCAGVGSNLATRVQTTLKWETKTMLIVTLCVLMFPPFWGLMGTWMPGYGFKHGWEMIVIACIFGAALGPMQGYSRVLFGLLIPEGQEASYFAIYQVTDKGSSFAGPLIVSVITQSAGSMRPALAYPLALVVLAIIILAMFDVDKAVEDKRLREEKDRVSIMLNGSYTSGDTVVVPVDTTNRMVEMNSSQDNAVERSQSTVPTHGVAAVKEMGKI